MLPDDVREQLLEGFGAETLIVVPPLRMEGTGHADVFVKLATPDTVLVTEPLCTGRSCPTTKSSGSMPASPQTREAPSTVSPCRSRPIPDWTPQRVYDVPESITPTVTRTATSGEGCEGRRCQVSLGVCLDTSPFWS